MSPAMFRALNCFLALAACVGSIAAGSVRASAEVIDTFTFTTYAVIAHPVSASGCGARVMRMAWKAPTALRRAVSTTERMSA